MNTQPAKPGILSSEFLGPIGFIGVVWASSEVDPSELVWPSVWIAVAYIVGRSIVKTAQAIAGKPEAVVALLEDEPRPQTAPQPKPSPRAAGHLAPLVPLVLGLGALAIVPSCSALQGFASRPVEAVEDGGGSVAVPTPGGGSIVYEGPIGPPVPPASIELPGGGSATYVPPASSSSPNVGQVAGETAGGVVGVLTGNPALGAIAAAVLGALGGAFGRRKG